MTLRCLFGHDVGTPVKRNGLAYWKCQRCHGLSPQPIDVPTLPDAPVLAKPKQRSPIWWVRGVYERSSAR